MTHSKLIPLDQVVEHARETNPEFRKIWDDTEFARTVAIQVVRYRAEQGMTQAQLGEMTGLTQPQVARLESGEETPTLKTLIRVSTATGLRFHVDVADGAATLVAA